MTISRPTVRPEDRGWLADRYVYAAVLPNVPVPSDSPLVEVDLRTVRRV